MPAEEAPTIIPTMSRAKISRHLSYPIGAEQVSSALVSTPQFPRLKLHFYFWSDSDLRRKEYEFLRIEYLNNVKPRSEYPIWTLHQRPPQWRWEIVVQPVPRELRHRIKKYITEAALPQIADWPRERSNLAQRGNDILTFFYNQNSDEFTQRPLTHLEPLLAHT